MIVLAGCIVVQPTSDEGCVDSLHDVNSKRESLLENLLVLLNSATDLGVGPSIAELGSRLEEGVIMTNSARGLENELVFSHFISLFINLLANYVTKKNTLRFRPLMIQCLIMLH